MANACCKECEYRSWVYDRLSSREVDRSANLEALCDPHEAKHHNWGVSQGPSRAGLKPLKRVALRLDAPFLVLQIEQIGEVTRSHLSQSPMDNIWLGSGLPQALTSFQVFGLVWVPKTV